MGADADAQDSYEKQRLCDRDELKPSSTRLNGYVMLMVGMVLFVLAIGAVSLLQCISVLFLHTPNPNDRQKQRRPLRLQGEPSCTGSGYCPLLNMFLDDTVHTAVAQNILTAGDPLLGPKDLVMVRQLVSESFSNISHSFHRYAPAIAVELNRLRINDTVKGHILDGLGLITDARVQAFGHKVAKAARAQPPSSRSDRASLMQHVEDSMWRHVVEIQRFKVSEVHRSVRALWASDPEHLWELTIELEAGGQEQLASRHTQSGAGQMARDRLLGGLEAISSAALTQGRALLDMLMMSARSEGRGKPSSVDRQGVAAIFLALQATHCPIGPVAVMGHDFARSLICPLKLGMLGVDALRFTESLHGTHDRSPCRSGETCPLRHLFFDPEVHRSVATNIVALGGQMVNSIGSDAVQATVAASFQDIGAALHTHARKVGKELLDLEVNMTVKTYLLEALALLQNPRVQEVGRTVNRALLSSSTLDNLKVVQAHLVTSLWEQFGLIQQMQLELVPWPVRRIWSWSLDQQWTITTERDNLHSVAAAKAAEAAGTASAIKDLQSYYAISSAAFEEGRVLLDLMMMCIRSNGPSWATALGRAATIFSGPLATHCESDSLASEKPSFRSKVICPLKFGMLGLDAMRFADHIYSSQHAERMPCGTSGDCPLRELLFDPAVHRRVASDIVTLAAEPHMLLGQADLESTQRVVAASFRNVSIDLQLHAAPVAAELNQLTVNITMKEYIVEALRVVCDGEVQDIGRKVQRVLLTVSQSDGWDGTNRILVKSLWRQLADFQKIQQKVLQWPIREMWRWAEAQQWQMTSELSLPRAMGNITGPSIAMPIDIAIASAAWAEGRVLLDLMMMCLQSKGPSWITSLRGMEDSFSRHLAIHCDPELPGEQRASLAEALLCPLRYGMLGLDVLRFADSIFLAEPPEKGPPCGPGAACPLERLLLDNYVHESVAADLIALAGEPYLVLGMEDMDATQQVVREVFRSISQHVQIFAQKAAAELRALKISEEEQAEFLRTMRLIAEPKVQAVGQEVAHNLGEVSNAKASADKLESDILRSISKSTLEDIEGFAAQVVRGPLHAIWGWGQDHQWSTATTRETVLWITDSASRDHTRTLQRRAPTLAPTERVRRRAAVLQAAALEEGLVLLDLMLMHVQALAPSEVANLHSALRDAFQTPFRVPCSLDAHQVSVVGHDSFGQTLLCPLKFGSLGLDAIRFAATGESLRPSSLSDQNG